MDEKIRCPKCGKVLGELDPTDADVDAQVTTAVSKHLCKADSHSKADSHNDDMA